MAVPATTGMAHPQRTGILGRVLRAGLLLTLLCVLVPLAPSMPSAGLDASWVVAMNEAVARHLVFGRDIVFTYGPYASVYTRQYHPDTDTMMLAASAWFAITYGGGLLYLLGTGRHWRVLALIVFFAGMLSTPDAPLLTYPLLMGLALSKWLRSGPPGRKSIVATGLALALAPLGLLVLIKGTLLILCAAVLLLCVGYLLVHRQWLLAALGLLVPPLAAQALWLAAGQPATALPRYLASMAPIAGGYTEAMALNGDALQLGLYALAATLLLARLARRPGTKRLQAAFETSLYALILFLAYKAGFVRHDAHAMLAGSTLLLAVLLLPFDPDRRGWAWLLAPALLCWAVIDQQVTKALPAHVIARLPASYGQAWQGLRERLGDRGALPARHALALRALRAQLPLALGAGPADIYSSGQAYLIAAGADWSPRPVFQSYSAYTPALAQANREHLLGPRAPLNLVFSIEPIDDRIASQEDGASWPVLLSYYQPTRMVDEFLLLQRQGAPAPESAGAPLQAGTHRQGERVPVPLSAGLLFAHVDARPTLIGRLVGMLFKPPPLEITVELADGRKQPLRLVSGMAQAGFLISPLIETTAEFARLYGPARWLAGKRVQAFSIAPRWGAAWLWNAEYTARIETLAARQADLSDLTPQLRPMNMPPGTSELVRENCQGGIDHINNGPPSAARAAAALPLSVDGWVARVTSDGARPDAVLVVLTDEQGRRSFLNAQPVQRPDVATYLRQPGLVDAGYHGVGDVAGLSGRYLVGLAFKRGAQVLLCANINMALDIEP